MTLPCFVPPFVSSSVQATLVTLRREEYKKDYAELKAEFQSLKAVFTSKVRAISEASGGGGEGQEGGRSGGAPKPLVASLT